MKGLDLSRSYWADVLLPALDARFPALLPRLAAGLVGEGSECWGFDDDLARDHDFDPTPCLWLSAPDFEAHAPALESLLASLPPPPRSALLSPEGRGRRGVHETGAFYRRFTGLSRPPRSLDEWRTAPEAGLAAATNGELFHDPGGAFTAIREALLLSCPADLRLARLARRLHAAGQSGQYNRARALRRGETVAAALALAEFIDATLAVAFLLARRHRPFSKWSHRALGLLPPPGPRLAALLTDLVAAGPGREPGLVEEISTGLADDLRAQGLSATPSGFLVDHAREVADRVEDPLLRRMAGSA